MQPAVSHRQLRNRHPIVEVIYFNVDCYGKNND